MLDTERKEPVPEGEKSLAERWQKRIKYFDEQHEERRKRWKENRTYVDGTPGEDGSAGLVRVNLTQSTLNTIQPAIYAKAPDVAVTPAERLDAEEYKPVKAVAKVSELVLKKEAIERGRLKVKGKAAVRASLTATTGWVWVYYETKTKKDPIVLGRLNDLQDNITRVNTLIAETADESKCGDYRAKLEELSHAQAGLQAQSEVTIATGIVMDSVAPDDVLIMDDSIKSIDDIAQASAIARRVRITVANYRDRFGKEPPKGTKKYERDSEADKKGQADQDDVMVDVWEIWCHDDLTVYTLPAGSNEWAREPFQPQVLGEQWYPAFPLQLNRVDGVLYPRCMVDNLRELVDEYNARRTKSREHRRKNNPIRVFRKDSGLTDAELKALNQAGATTDFVGLSGNPSEPIQAAIGSLEAIPFDPMMYDTSDILRDIEMTSGAQDAARGGMVEAKTATEAEIMAQGNQSKASEALDVIEDWLTEILRYSYQLLLQNMTQEQVGKKYGDNAATAWPVLSKEEIFSLVDIGIRAGSTSKPNKMRERDQWMQFLPLLQQGVMQYLQAVQAGDQKAEQAAENIIDETLRRFDERLTLKQLLGNDDDPFSEGEEEPDPMAQREAMKQQIMQEMQGQMQAAQQAIAGREEELNARDQDLTKRDGEIKVAEAQVKAGNEALMFKADLLKQHEAKRQADEGEEEMASATIEQIMTRLERIEQATGVM